MANREFYLIARSSSEHGGIYRCILDAGSPQILGFTAAAGINYLVFSADRRFAYASGGNADRQALVRSFRRTDAGDFLPAEPVPSGGRNACALCTDPAGKFLWCADYDSGDVVEFPLTSGKIGAPVKMICHHGSGPVRGRQDSPHVHQVQLTPDGRYLAVNDLGCDTVTCYPLDGRNGISEAGAKVHHAAPGDGPRHLLFAPDGRHAYQINELGNSIAFLAYADGTFRELAKVSTLPAECHAATKASAIRLSPDHRWLFASNRGFDSIAVFALLPDGTPELHEIVPSGGVSPRDAGMLPGGEDFAAANEGSNAVTFFHWDGNAGKLTATGRRLDLDHPLFIAW